MLRPPPRSTLFPYTRSSDLPVADDHDGAAPRAQLADHPEDGADLVVVERGGRLVEDQQARVRGQRLGQLHQDRKSTRLNSSHGYISYAVFCLKKKKTRPSAS